MTKNVYTCSNDREECPFQMALAKNLSICGKGKEMKCCYKGKKTAVKIQKKKGKKP